jgi:hypothetical protein
MAQDDEPTVMFAYADPSEQEDPFPVAPPPEFTIDDSGQLHFIERRVFAAFDDSANRDPKRWVLDTGASNHMTGARSAFSNLDIGTVGTVRFGDGSVANIEGIGTVLFACKNGEHRTIPNVAAVEMVFWLMGSLADRSLTQVWLAAPPILAGIGMLLLLGRALDALSLGEDAARSLGIDVVRTRLAVVAGTALAVGAATSVTGVIGFVGLLVPHVLRPFVGHRPSLLLPASALAGAIFLLVADIALRLAQPWMDLRIGVLTALIGAPFFVWLVLKTRAELAP